MQTLQWFKDRIGKRVYRNHNECCAECTNVAINGIVVQDKLHAEYIYAVQCDFENDGVKLDYRDEK